MAKSTSDRKKTVCPISREEFRKHAPPMLPVTLNGATLVAVKKEFETRSLGYNVNARYTLEIAGKAVEFQVGMNVTAVGSKELPV